MRSIRGPVAVLLALSFAPALAQAPQQPAGVKAAPGPAPDAPPVPAAQKTEHLPIHQAAIRGDIEGLKRELAAGVPVDQPVRGGEEWHQGSTPLMWATRAGTLEAVEFLISQGARARLGSTDGTTALMLATAARDHVLERVDVLIKAGSDVNAVRWDGGTPLIWAASFCTTPGVATKLIEAGAAVDTRRPRDGTTALMLAARAGNTVALAELIKAGADVGARSTEGFTALHWAALGERGNAETVGAVLDAGVNIEERSKEGSTPLMLAAAKGGVARVRALLARGADPKATNARGDTALMAAAQAGDVHAVKALIEAGAPLDAANADGVTALCLAVIKGEPTTVRLLLGRGASVRTRTKAGWTPILLAKSIVTLEPLLEAGAAVDDRASEAPAVGWTPLMFAASEGDLLSIRRLLRAGADPTISDLTGVDALALAANRVDQAGTDAAIILQGAIEQAKARRAAGENPGK